MARALLSALERIPSLVQYQRRCRKLRAHELLYKFPWTVLGKISATCHLASLASSAWLVYGEDGNSSKCSKSVYLLPSLPFPKAYLSLSLSHLPLVCFECLTGMLLFAGYR